MAMTGTAVRTGTTLAATSSAPAEAIVSDVLVDMLVCLDFLCRNQQHKTVPTEASSSKVKTEIAVAIVTLLLLVWDSGWFDSIEP